MPHMLLPFDLVFVNLSAVPPKPLGLCSSWKIQGSLTDLVDTATAFEGDDILHYLELKQ